MLRIVRRAGGREAGADVFGVFATFGGPSFHLTSGTAPHLTPTPTSYCIDALYSRRLPARGILQTFPRACPAPQCPARTCLRGRLRFCDHGDQHPGREA